MLYWSPLLSNVIDVFDSYVLFPGLMIAMLGGFALIVTETFVMPDVAAASNTDCASICFVTGISKKRLIPEKSCSKQQYYNNCAVYSFKRTYHKSCCALF